MCLDFFFLAGLVVSLARCGEWLGDAVMVDGRMDLFGTVGNVPVGLRAAAARVAGRAHPPAILTRRRSSA